MGKRHRAEDKNGKRKSNIYSELLFYFIFYVFLFYLEETCSDRRESILLNSMQHLYMDQKLCGTGLKYLKA